MPIMIKDEVWVNDSEMELIIRAKRGDKKAYEALISGYTNRLYGYLYRMTGSVEDAEDILQEALSAAYQNLRQFMGKSLFSTWLYRIAINICCKELRQRRLGCFYNKVAVKGEHDLNTDGVASVELVDKRADALKRTIEDEEKQKVRMAIAKLPRRLAEVITLRELEECDYEEISARLGIPRGTVMSRLYRSRLKLARILKRNAARS